VIAVSIRTPVELNNIQNILSTRVSRGKKVDAQTGIRSNAGEAVRHWVTVRREDARDYVAARFLSNGINAILRNGEKRKGGERGDGAGPALEEGST